MQFCLQTLAKKFYGSVFLLFLPQLFTAIPFQPASGWNWQQVWCMWFLGCSGRTQVRWMLLDFTSFWTLAYLDSIPYQGWPRSPTKRCCIHCKTVKVVNVCSRCYFLWWYTPPTTASFSGCLRCFVPLCPVHYELASIISIFTVGPAFCDDNIQTFVEPGV